MILINVLLNLIIVFSIYISVYLLVVHSKGWFAGMFSLIERLIIIIGVCLIAYASIKNLFFYSNISTNNFLMNVGLAIITTSITYKIYNYFTKRKL
jgi:hypothetical protein